MQQHNDDSEPGQPADASKRRQPGFKDVVSSVFAAAFGVQSSKNRERDFKHGKARTFIIAGIVFTALFVLTVFSVVKMVLQQAGH